MLRIPGHGSGEQADEGHDLEEDLPQGRMQGGRLVVNAIRKEEYELVAANRALADLRIRHVRGAKVLRIA